MSEQQPVKAPTPAEVAKRIKAANAKGTQAVTTGPGGLVSALGTAPAPAKAKP